MPIRTFLTTSVLTIAASTAAIAQSPNQIGTHRDWSTYEYSDGRGKVCYVASQPKQTEPSGVNRDPIFFMISARPAEQVSSEASIIIGYPIKEGSSVTAVVDGTTFTLMTKDDGAWVQSPADEQELVAAMRRGVNMVVRGTSRRGTQTTDTYSLSGVTAALEQMAQACK